jgi:hypothetical protein
MRTVAQIISVLSLAGTIMPALLFFAGRIDLAQVKFWMLVWTVAWFVATPLWMERKVKG